MTTTVKYVFSVAQICNLSVSVQIVASRDDFAERGHPGRSVSPTRESRELTDVSAVGNRCAQDGRAPFRLRLHRAAPYRRFLIGRASAMSAAGPRQCPAPLQLPTRCRMEFCGTTQRGQAATKVLECGGKRSATPLWLRSRTFRKRCRRFACHRTPKSSWSATIFADTL